MSKIKQKLFSKPYNNSLNDEFNKNVQEIMDLYSKNNSNLKNIQNKNNITIDYPKHYSPTHRSPIYLPSINSNFKRINQSQNRKINNSLNEGNFFSNIGNKIINEKRPLKREKTQVIILNNDNDNDNFLPQVNNITNINIHIYQNKNQNFSINNNIATNRKKKKLKGNIKINSTFNKGKSNFNLPFSISDDFNSNDITKELNKNNNLSNRKIIVNNNNTNNNNNNNNYNNNSLSTIDNSVNFLRDFSNEPNTFISFLKLIQNHLDIEIMIDNALGGNGNNMFRRKANVVITNEINFKLSKLINNYFNLISSIYINNSNVNDNFFLFPYMNNILHKCIKVQMLIFSSLFITLSQLGIYEINAMFKNHFHKIIKELSNPLFNLFELFIHDEINIKYPEMIKSNLRLDFDERFNKLYLENKINKGYKNNELLSIINKNIDKSTNSLKYYSTLNLKYSLIKPYGDALNQLIISIERKNLIQFSNIILKTLLFGELEINKNKLLTRPQLINSINNISPFLPPIDSKYKYTLVLDMDETLIHFFFTHINGMFFVRPFCFDFLNELNDLYEIITFTAGTKDYADMILNQLDINNNIFKYRLYRQHITISELNIFKDLDKIGRDLSKTIIIDNLKDNFKMHPNNGIFIKTWTSDINDIQLRDLKKILKDIVKYNVDDVREIILKMNDEIRISKNVINPYSNIDISKYI